MLQQRSKTASRADHNMMRELNRSLVLDLLKQSSPISRAALAKATRLAKPTVSAIVEDLLDEGLVDEIGVGVTTTGGGRPPIMLQFNVRSQFVAGVHIGVHRTTIVVADACGQEVGRLETATSKAGPAKLLKQVAAGIRSTLHEADAAEDRLAAVGVCMPGLTDSEQGICLLAPNLGWRNVDVRGLLGRALDVPITVHNASQAVLVAECTEGAGQGETEVVLLYVGTGVGAALLVDGRLHHGIGGVAGEIGHCRVSGATDQCNCGKVGCLETVASGPAIARAAQQAVLEGHPSLLSRSTAHPADISPEDVAAAAAQGDSLALEVLAAAGRELGLGASWLINLFNPAAVIVSGGLVAIGEPLLDPLRQSARENSLPQSGARAEIRVARLGQDSEVRGAVLLALQCAETYYRVVVKGSDRRRAGLSALDAGQPA